MNYGQSEERSKHEFKVYVCRTFIEYAICVVPESQTCRKHTDNKGLWHPAGQTGHEGANNVKMTGAEIKAYGTLLVFHPLVLLFMDEVLMLLLLSTPLYLQTLLLPVFLSKTLVSPPISPVFITIDLSLSRGCTPPYESPISFSSVITVFPHVVFVHHGFLLPGGIRLRATLGILSLFILRTRPSHLNRRCLITRTALLLKDFHIRYFIGPEYLADLSQVCSLSMSFPLL